jgi:hypothetical protein
MLARKASVLLAHIFMPHDIQARVTGEDNVRAKL